jgi:hypothetical protein
MDGLNAAAPPGPVMLPCATRLLLETLIFAQNGTAQPPRELSEIWALPSFVFLSLAAATPGGLRGWRGLVDHWQAAVRAAFKAGVKPFAIARQFGISQSDVRKALARRDRRPKRHARALSLSGALVLADVVRVGQPIGLSTRG